jgi:CheY-like chemotaxis protein
MAVGPERDSGRNTRVLVAEDDPNDRTLIEDALRSVVPGLELDFSADGEELLTRLKSAKENPDIILIDLNLPRMNGNELLKAIKGDARLRRIPLIVLTDSSRKKDVCDAYEAGATAFIVKPNAPSSFAAALRMAVGFSVKAPQVPVD